MRLPPPITLEASSNPLQELADKLALLCGAQRLALPLDSAAALGPSTETFVSFPLLPLLRLILKPRI
jgi:hypothetical protein